MLSRDIFLGTVQSVGSSAVEDEGAAAPNECSTAVSDSGCVRSAPIPIKSALFLGPEELV